MRQYALPRSYNYVEGGGLGVRATSVLFHVLAYQQPDDLVVGRARRLHFSRFDRLRRDWPARRLVLEPESATSLRRAAIGRPARRGRRHLRSFRPPIRPLTRRPTAVGARPFAATRGRRWDDATRRDARRRRFRGESAQLSAAAPYAAAPRA